MFFEEELSYTIIDDTIDDSFLQEWCKENDIYLEIVDNPTRWCAFSQYYARKNRLDPFASTSFAYIISMVMTGMGISAGTEIYYKEEAIFDKAVVLFAKLQEQYDDEEIIAMFLFNKLFDEYRFHIQEYELKTESVSVRMGISTYLKFQKIHGKNNTDKFFAMLDYCTE